MKNTPRQHNERADNLFAARAAIPQFPSSKPLEMGDKPVIEAFARRFAPYSDFSFVNLVSYNIRDEFQISHLNGNLVLRMLDYITSEPFYTFIGDHRPLDTVQTLLAFADKATGEPTLRLIPEETIKAIHGSCARGFLVSEDPDSFDYILLVSDLIELSSKEFSKKRQSINGFRRNYPHHRVVKINLCDSAIQSAIRHLLNIWREAKHKSNEEVAIEFMAIDRCFELSTTCELITVGGFIDGHLMGFTINELVHSGFYTGHFGKTCPRHKGFASLLEHETAKVMKQLGCSHMNYQQDLGLPGLRMAKRSWHPSSYLKKFTISPIAGRKSSLSV